MIFCDIAVIGAGVTGTAVARELSRYKLSLLLIEREAEPAFGVSKSNSGIVHPGTQNPPESLKGRLCTAGNRLLHSLADELDIPVVRTGELIVGFYPEDRKKLLEMKKDAEKLGVPGLRLVDRKWLRKNEPNLSPEALCALHAPTAAIISPYRLAYAFADNARQNGVELLTESPVTRISPLAPQQFEIAAGREIIRCRFIVNAAGLFADEINRMAGGKLFVITPRKGEEYILDRKTEHIVRHVLFPLPTPVSKGILIIKTSDGNPMIGPTAEETEDKSDLSTSEEGLEKVLAGARRMIPSIRKQDIIAYFAGLRPVAGKDFIIRHEDGVPGLVNAAGIQSPGLTASPAIALMVRDILKQNGLKLASKPRFVRRRKKTVHLFSLPWKKIRKAIAKDPSYGDIVCRCETVSAGEIREAIRAGARTLDGVKFRTRCQSGRCHGGFCTTRLLHILSEETGIPITELTKRGGASRIVPTDRNAQS